MSGWTPPPHDPYLDLADSAAMEAAVRARQEQRDLTERAAELASWIGTLRDLAERQSPISLRSRTGRVHRGVLLAVAEDHVAVALPARQTLFLRHDAISAVRPDPTLRVPAAMGDRERAQDRTLLEVLDRAVVDRATVYAVVEGSDDILQGLLLSVGEDVVSVRLTSSGQDVVYLRAQAIIEVAVER